MQTTQGPVKAYRTKVNGIWTTIYAIEQRIFNINGTTYEVTGTELVGSMTMHWVKNHRTGETRKVWQNDLLRWFGIE